jgi:hypothetical protein
LIRWLTEVQTRVSTGLPAHQLPNVAQEGKLPTFVSMYSPEPGGAGDLEHGLAV